MKVKIQNNNLAERRYILDVLLNDFLGLEYEVEESDDTIDWTIELDNTKSIVLKDAFFNSNREVLSYLKTSNSPKCVSFVSNQFTPEEDIPIIYGNSDIQVSDRKVYCGIDIFASSFFMLTRWEEYVNKNRDTHNRFPATESLALKNNFLHRPIVNEYIEMLWNIFKYLGYKGGRKQRKYELMVTHDVDMVQKYPHLFSGVKEMIADVLKRRQITLAFHKLKLKTKVLFNKEKDPYDTFDWLMDLSEQISVKSYFFFMGRGKTKFDNYYKTTDDFIQKLVKKIKKRGHFIGMHPTYDAYNNRSQMKREKEELEINLKTTIEFGREHYLRFEVPTTWQIWEDNNMKWDSTLSFADKEGFRCGVCYEFSVFNILTREKLKLKEKPLIVMEGSFSTYQRNIEPSKMEEKIKRLVETVKKYEGTFIFLWHNSSFNVGEWKKFESMYKNILQMK